MIEIADQIMPGADRDIVAPLMKRLSRHFEAIHLNTKVTRVDVCDAALKASLDGADAPGSGTFDKILVAVGRTPNGSTLESTGVVVDDRGFIPVDRQMRTAVPHIFAIGDIVGPPMLAHKATHEAKVAAEVAAGRNAAFDARAIPSVAYTDPEVAWVGLTENRAKEEAIAYGQALDCGIVGSNAGDLMAEATLALEMGADTADIAGTVHPHPTLSETFASAAEMFDGTITDLMPPRRRPP